MNATVTAALYAIFLWWFSTGAIFYFNARPQRTFRWSLLGATLVLALALLGLWASAGQQTASGAMIAFSCGLLIWGWHTMTYFMGIITGPRRRGCANGCKGWTHFLHAAQTGLYHEAAIILTFVLMIGLTWKQPNQFGLWTFVLLWVMHLSAKLNVFLGVRNLNKEFIPPHLKYLTCFFRRRAMNLLFPLSVTGGTTATVLLATAAFDPAADVHHTIGMTLLATLMALAVIEHWFMMLPIPAERLWRWSLTPEVPVVAQSSSPTSGSCRGHSSAHDSSRLQVRFDAVEPRSGVTAAPAPERLAEAMRARLPS